MSKFEFDKGGSIMYENSEGLKNGEPVYSYFCKYDELVDVVACPGIDFPALKDSCYVSRESVFGPAPKE